MSNQSQINVTWRHGGVMHSSSYAEHILRIVSVWDSNIVPGHLSTTNDITSFSFKTSYPARALQTIDMDNINAGFEKYDPESYARHDPMSVRVQVMPRGLLDPQNSADVINYLSEKVSMLTGDLLSTQSRVYQLEQMLQQAQQVNLHNYGLKQLPNIVKHMNTQLQSIGCEQYVIEKPTKH